MNINVDLVNCEAFFSKLLAERSSQLVMALKEVQQLRAEVEELRIENKKLKEEEQPA